MKTFLIEVGKVLLAFGIIGAILFVTTLLSFENNNRDDWNLEVDFSTARKVSER